MDKDISPEEKLLKLIRMNPRKEKLPSEDENTPKANKEIKPATELKPEKKKHKSESSTQPWQVLPQLKNIILVNKALFLVFTVLIIYFLVDYFFLPSAQIPEIEVEGTQIEEIIKEKPQIKPFSYYSNEITGKTVFKPLPIEEAEPQILEDEEELEDIMSNLSLLGIVAGATPQAIIQDNIRKKSSFTGVGDSVGGAEVKEILEAEGRVIMTYKGKDFDLSM